jgi:hypothetical protein
LHLAALWLQGSDGTIAFDWTHVPAHPTMTRSAPVAGIAGGLLFFLLPSLFSVIVLAVLWLTRHRHNILLHGVLLVYLVFDLVINIVGYESGISDFRFLQVVSLSFIIMASVVTVLMAWAGYMCVLLLADVRRKAEGV